MIYKGNTLLCEIGNGISSFVYHYGGQLVIKS